MQRRNPPFSRFDFDVITDPVEPRPMPKPSPNAIPGQAAAALTPAHDTPIDVAKPAA